MTRATRHYRLRIRNAADSADALILSSVPGGINPYLTGPPQGDGQEIDPATGESSIGAYTIAAADVSEIVTAALVDAGGHQTLIQRRAYIELSTDGGSSWPIVLVPGFVNGYRLVTPMRWAFTVGESRRIEYTRQVWDRVTDNFEQATCLIGEPVRGNWGPMIDHGGWRFVVTGSDSDTVTLHFHSGYLPIDGITPKYENATPLESDFGALTAYARNRANQLAAPEVVLAETAAGEAKYPGIVVLVETEAAVEVDRFTARAQVAATGSLPHVILTRMDEIKLLRVDTVWSGSPPSNGTIFRLYAWRTTIGEDNPLHIHGHPIDILTDLWDEAGIAYDSTEATAVRTALGANTRLTLRITEPWKLRDVETMMGGLFGFGSRVGTDGELELITTRIRGIAAPSGSYDEDDLRSKDTVIFEVDEESIYNTVTVEQLRFERWGQGLGERPVDDVVATTCTRSRDLNSEGGATPDSDTFGIRDLRYEVPGKVVLDVSGLALGDRDFEDGLALEVFDRFGRGGLYGTVAALPVITEKVGEELRLDVSHLPNAGTRGGERILQVVRRTETPSGPELLLLDSGPNSQFSTSPTFSLAAGAADARKYVDVTITNAAALNTAEAWLRIEWAVAATEPTGGSLWKQYGTGEIPSSFTLPAVDAGSHVWVRMRAFQQEKRSTAFTAWDDVDLTDLTAPSSLDDSAGSDPARITITFTPGETDIPLEVFQRPQGDPAGEARVVDNLSPGSDRVTLTLVPGNSYTIGIRHREAAPFSGVSSTTETSFAVAGSADTLSPPTNPYALGIKWPTDTEDPVDWPEDPTVQYAVGLRVRSAIEEGFIEFDMATETAVESGIPGSYSTEETRSVTGVGETYSFMIDVPLDGKLRYFRARHVRSGAVTSSYTSVVSVLPGDILTPPPAVDPLEITDIVPVTLGGTGVADPTDGVLLLGAGADPVTELAPGAAAGYARSTGSAWARSGLLAADLTGTVASARLSGVYSGITGLAEQAQALDMGGNDITDVGALTATEATFTGNVLCSKGSPQYRFTETDADTDAKNWNFLVDTEVFLLRVYDDAWSGLETVFAVTRSGASVVDTRFHNGTVTIDEALIATDATFTGDVLSSKGTPAYRFTETDGGTDAKNWSVSVHAEGFRLLVVDDAWSASELAFEVTRSGATVVDFRIHNGTLTVDEAATFSSDLTIGSLGTFDSTSVPDLDDVLRHNGSKWIPVALQFRFTDGDVSAEAFTDGTAASYVHDGRSLSGTPTPAPAAAPVLVAGYKSFVVDMTAYGALGATEAFEVSWSDDSGSTWSDTGGDSIVTTGDKVMHTQLLIDATTYRYRYRVVGATPTSWSPETSDQAPLSEPDITPATILLASQISTVDLASISANIGVITAGAIRNSANTKGILISGQMSDWSGWTRFLNLVDETDNFIEHERFKVHHDGTIVISDGTNTLFTINTAGSSAYWQNAAATAGVNIAGTIPGGWTRYLNLSGSGAMLLHDKLTLNYDGSIYITDETNTLFTINAAGSTAYWQNSAGTAGVNIAGTVPGGWTRYLNLNASGTMLKHDVLELNYDGSAVFGGEVDILEGTLTGGAFGDKHIFVRDPDLEHGMTGIVETDVAGAIGLSLSAGATSGMGLVGFSIGNRGLSLGAVATTPLTDMGSLAVMTFESWKKSGTSRDVLADGELAFSWHNGTTALMALWGDGSLAIAGPAILRYDASNYTTFAVASAGDLSITCTGTDPDRFGIVLGATERMAVDDTAVSGHTSLFLYDPATSSLSRVKVGANGTGPAGDERALYMEQIPI